jgi:hypothetical protein
VSELGLPDSYGQVAYEAAIRWRRDNVPATREEPSWSELDAKARAYFDAVAQGVADYLKRVPT